jgi:hypothetical protein
VMRAKENERIWGFPGFGQGACYSIGVARAT